MQSSSLSLLGEPHFPAMLGRIFCKRVKLSPAFVPSKGPSKSSFSSEAYASANACLQHALQTVTPCCLQQKKPHNTTSIQMTCLWNNSLFVSRNGVGEAVAPSQSAESGSKCCPHCSQSQTGPLCKVGRCCKIAFSEVHKYPIGSSPLLLQH
jgi:hypothetical protein